MAALPNFSFVRPGRLAGMAMPTAPAQIQRLAQEHNVGMVVSLVEPKDAPAERLFDGTGVQHVCVAWPNGGVPSEDALREAAAAARQLQEQQQKAVVFHCAGGRGRTGTGLASFLILSAFAATRGRV